MIDWWRMAVRSFVVFHFALDSSSHYTRREKYVFEWFLCFVKPPPQGAMLAAVNLLCTGDEIFFKDANNSFFWKTTYLIFTLPTVILSRMRLSTDKLTWLLLVCSSIKLEKRLLIFLWASMYAHLSSWKFIKLVLKEENASLFALLLIWTTKKANLDSQKSGLEILTVHAHSTIPSDFLRLSWKTSLWKASNWIDFDYSDWIFLSLNLP